MEMETWARVTPFSLQVGGSSCPAWLHYQLHGQPADEPFFRWDIRNRLLLRLCDAHAVMGAPAVAELRPEPAGLLSEQSWFYRHFGETYCDLFAGEPGREPRRAALGLSCLEEPVQR